ncbi:MAG: adenylate/guanylate cyclase domain-containing protein, partial [Bacteroidota bacterium]
NEAKPKKLLVQRPHKPAGFLIFVLTKKQMMSKPHTSRRLAAVMFTDIVGYTAIMQRDEQQAATVRQKHRDIFEKSHHSHHGEIVQYFGDGTLSVFQSAIEAVECAIHIQQVLNTQDGIPLRIGIHLGDIVFDGTDIFGNGVNVASRIESIGLAGSILISGRLQHELLNQSHISTQSFGQFEFKNVGQPIEIFAITNEGVKVPKPNTLKGHKKQNGKSIAVLPFVNMSHDPEHEYFSDGITEEIINALTKIQGLKVIARTSSFAFKGKNIDIREIGQRLDVSTLLEGSVRHAGNRVRITAQLIHADDGSHMFSKNFDRQLEDIFELQDEISLLIANQIRENFGHIEIAEQLVVPTTQNIEAYQLYLKGRYHMYQLSREGFEEAIKYMLQSHAKDPDFAQPLYALVHCYGSLATWGFMPREEGLMKTQHYFVEASKITIDVPEYYFTFVLQSLWVEWDFNLAYQYLQQTLKRYPNYLLGIQAMTEFCMIVGRFGQAREMLERAIAIDPMMAVHLV